MHLLSGMKISEFDSGLRWQCLSDHALGRNDLQLDFHPRSDSSANLGHFGRSLVKPLQTMRLWPGDPKQIAVCITDANVENISSKIEGIQNYIYPVRDKYSGSHSGCGFTTKLHNTTNEILKDKAADVVKANRKHLEIQRGKFEPSLAPLKLG